MCAQMTLSLYRARLGCALNAYELGVGSRAFVDDCKISFSSWELNVY